MDKVRNTDVKVEMDRYRGNNRYNKGYNDLNSEYERRQSSKRKLWKNHRIKKK